MSCGAMELGISNHLATEISSSCHYFAMEMSSVQREAIRITEMRF